MFKQAYPLDGTPDQHFPRRRKVQGLARSICLGRERSSRYCVPSAPASTMASVILPSVSATFSRSGILNPGCRRRRIGRRSFVFWHEGYGFEMAVHRQDERSEQSEFLAGRVSERQQGGSGGRNAWCRRDRFRDL